MNKYNVCLYKGFDNENPILECIDYEVIGLENAFDDAKYYNSMDGKTYVVTDLDWNIVETICERR